MVLAGQGGANVAQHWGEFGHEIESQATEHSSELKQLLPLVLDAACWGIQIRHSGR